MTSTPVVRRSLVVGILTSTFIGVIGLLSGCSPLIKMSESKIASSLSPTNHQISLSLVAGVDDSSGIGHDGVGTAARFFAPASVATDGVNLYVSDSSNNTIRKILISTGAVTTLAGVAGPGQIFGTDSTDGTGATASFFDPQGVATDGVNVYVADNKDGYIRQVNVSTGNTTTLAGIGGEGFSDSTDGNGDTASFGSVMGVAITGSSLYVTDSGAQAIRKVELGTGNTTTLTGTAGLFSGGYQDGNSATAQFQNPLGIATDGTNLYIADSGNNVIRQIVISTGMTSTLAGSAITAGSADSSDGTGGTARFNGPTGLVLSGADLYVTDNGSTIRKVVIATGNTTTIAGTAGVTGVLDSSNGTGTSATFNGPGFLSSDGTNLYVPDKNSNTIREVTIANGDTTTLAGFPNMGTTDSTDGRGDTARFENPVGVVSDGVNLYIADEVALTIRKTVIATGETTTLAGLAGVGGVVNSTDGTGATARFAKPMAIAIVGQNLYVVDSTNLGAYIRKVVIATGETTNLAGGGSGPSLDSTDGTGATAVFVIPLGIATDGTFLYVADTRAQTIRKVAVSSGNTTTIAGTLLNGGDSDSTDGTGATASFLNPTGLAVSGGFVYVADSGNATIRKVDAVTGNTITVAGNPSLEGSTDGTGTSALFQVPQGLTTDGSSLYIVDTNTIRRFSFSTSIVDTYVGPTGTLLQIPANQTPSMQGIFWNAAGLFFTNQNTGVYQIN